MKISKEDRIIGPCFFDIEVTKEEYQRLEAEGKNMRRYTIRDENIVIPDWLKGSQHTSMDNKKDQED